MNMNKKKLAAKILTILALGLYQTATPVFALPAQGTLDNTNAATITTADNIMTISGKGKNNILNWANFQVANGEKVQFSGNNNYLNLVHGVDISRIYGTISGGNIIYLVNPNGILFGQGTKLDNVGSFVASTRNISSINKEAFLNDPTNTTQVLGHDNPIMDNKDYYPDNYPYNSSYNYPYVPKISVAEMQLTNVPASATKIILDGPGGVILKNTALLDQTTQVITRQNGGEIGIGSDTGNIVLNDAQKAKIALVYGITTSAYHDYAGVLQGYQTIKNMDEFRSQEGSSKSHYMIVNNIDNENREYIPITASGTLEGLGYTISNLKSTSDGNVGLYDTFMGTARNLNLQDIDFTGRCVGGFAAVFKWRGSISNVNVSGNIIARIIDDTFGLGGIHGGGILGKWNGYGDEAYSVIEIRNSRNYADIFAYNTENSYSDVRIGGIIGGNGGNTTGLFNVYNTGNLTAINNSTKYRIGIIIKGIGDARKIMGAVNKGNISAKITDIELATNRDHTIRLSGIAEGLYNNRYIGNGYNLGEIISQSNIPEIYIGGIITEKTNLSNVAESAIDGKKLESFYIKDNVKIGNTTVSGADFGIGVTQEKMAEIFNPDMIGVHDFSRTQGDVISGVPDNGGSVTPPVNPDNPSKPIVPPTNPDNPSKPIVPPTNPDNPSKPIVPPTVPEHDRVIPDDYNGVITGVLNDSKPNRKNNVEEQIKNNYKDGSKQSVKYETPRENYDKQKEHLIQKIMNEFNDAQSKYQAQKEANRKAGFNELKSYIKTTDGTIFDDRVYEAFLKPIREKMERANLDAYDAEVGINFVQQIADMIGNGIVHTEDQKVKVNGVTYTIHYDLDYSLHKMTTVIATVSWREGKANKSTTMTLTNVNTKNGVKALENYANGLSKLNKDAWENAASEFLSCGLSKKTSGVREKKIKDICTKLLNALDDDQAAEAFANDMGGSTRQYIIDEGKGIFKNHAKKGVEKFVKKIFASADEITQAVDQLHALEQLKDDCSTYSSADASANKKLNAYWNASNVLTNMILNI